MLATNHGTDTIVKFHTAYLKDQPDSVLAKPPLARLDSTLKREFTAEMGAPMTGRFTQIVPFFPFSAPEQAVVAHKFILDFTDKLRLPIDLLANRLVGHVYLRLQNDGQIAARLAEVGYEEALGARSLQRVVQLMVQVRVAERYVEGDEEIVEGTNEGPLQRFGVRLEGGEEGGCEVVVSKEGLAGRISFAERFVCLKGDGGSEN